MNEAGFKRYAIHLTDSGMTANSVNHYIRSVKVFLYWCMEQDEIAPLKIKMVKAQETIKDVYTQEELCALIQPPKREDSFVVWRSWADLLKGVCRAYQKGREAEQQQRHPIPGHAFQHL